MPTPGLREENPPVALVTQMEVNNLPANFTQFRLYGFHGL
jgi:hypothetical protein